MHTTSRGQSFARGANFLLLLPKLTNQKMTPHLKLSQAPARGSRKPHHVTCRPSTAILGRARSLHGYSTFPLHRSGCASTRHSARYPSTLGSLNKPASPHSDGSWPTRQRARITTSECFRQGADHVITRDLEKAAARLYSRPRPPGGAWRRPGARAYAGSRGVSRSAPPPACPRPFRPSLPPPCFSAAATAAARAACWLAI